MLKFLFIIGLLSGGLKAIFGFFVNKGLRKVIFAEANSREFNITEIIKVRDFDWKRIKSFGIAKNPKHYYRIVEGVDTSRTIYRFWVEFKLTKEGVQTSWLELPIKERPM